MPVVRKRGSVTLKQLGLRMTKFSDRAVQVGINSELRYPDGPSVAEVAETQEFGNANIPPRSFMRTTVMESRQEWLADLRFGAKLVLEGVETPDNVLDMVGARAVNDIQNKIKEIDSPPLAASTIAKRKRKGVASSNTKPLIETGLLISSVEHEVIK